MGDGRYSLVVGGPFHALLARLGLVDAAGLPRAAAAGWLVLLAWGVPAACIALQASLDPGFSGDDFWWDPRVYVRWIVAIAAMLLYERITDGVFNQLIGNFRTAAMIEPAVAARFSALLARADARTSSAGAEGLMLLVVLLLSAGSLEIRWATPNVNWAERGTGTDLVMSWAGLAVTFLSDPLFLFLLCRWIWRFVAVGWLLAGIARLPLRLYAAHPDGLAGLGFLGSYPAAFLGLFFALSCVVATGIQHFVQFNPVGTSTVVLAAGLWVAFIAAIAVAPTLVFVPVLAAVRTAARREFSRLAVRHHAEFHRTWLADDAPADRSPMGTPEMSSLADLNAVAASALNVGLVPVDRRTVAAVILAAGLPLLPVMPTSVPLTELLPTLVGFLL
jgi:hypothetical protein